MEKEEPKIKTIILPGLSPHNKDWADDTAGQLTSNRFLSIVHNWRHWSKGGSLNLNYEIRELLKKINMAYTVLKLAYQKFGDMTQPA